MESLADLRQGRAEPSSQHMPGAALGFLWLSSPRGPGDADVATLRAALRPEQPMGPIPARLPQQPRPEAAARASGRPARLARADVAGAKRRDLLAGRPRHSREGGGSAKGVSSPPPRKRKAGPAPPRRLGGGPLSLPGTPAPPPPHCPRCPGEAASLARDPRQSGRGGRSGAGPPPLGTARARSPPARRAAFSALGSLRGPGGTSRAGLRGATGTAPGRETRPESRGGGRSAHEGPPGEADLAAELQARLLRPDPRRAKGRRS